LDLGGHDGDAGRHDLVVEHDDRQPVRGEADQVVITVVSREDDDAIDAFDTGQLGTALVFWRRR
jgi:hypothetical protein